MPRIHLFEFEDLHWFPDTIRKGMTDYLSFFLRAMHFYKPAVPLIAECLERSGDNKILDLCSGSGGPAIQAAEQLIQKSGKQLRLSLSDKYPNPEAVNTDDISRNTSIKYIQDPVDARHVPTHLSGMRTIFSAFHHFRPEDAQTILRDAVQENVPIAIFDGGDKNILTVLGIVVIHPVLFIFCTPFFRPFRWSRLLFTYLIPLIPLCTIWDGLVSVLRFYTPRDMLRMAGEIDSGSYTWTAGKKSFLPGAKMAYLIGYPKSRR